MELLSFMQMFEKRNGCIDPLLMFFGLMYLVFMFKDGDSWDQEVNNVGLVVLGILFILYIFRNQND